MGIENVLLLNILKYIIAGSGLVIAAVYGCLTYRYRKEPCFPIKISFSIMGAYWAFYYIQSIAGGILPAHQIWVRVPLWMTLTVIIAQGIFSLRKLNR